MVWVFLDHENSWTFLSFGYWGKTDIFSCSPFWTQVYIIWNWAMGLDIFPSLLPSELPPTEMSGRFSPQSYCFRFSANFSRYLCIGCTHFTFWHFLHKHHSSRVTLLFKWKLLTLENTWMVCLQPHIGPNPANCLDVKNFSENFEGCGLSWWGPVVSFCMVQDFWKIAFILICFSGSCALNFIAQAGAIHRVGKNLIAFVSTAQLKFPCWPV